VSAEPKRLTRQMMKKIMSGCFVNPFQMY